MWGVKLNTGRSISSGWCVDSLNKFVMLKLKKIVETYQKSACELLKVRPPPAVYVVHGL